MFFISMDLLGPYHKTENGNQYTLTVICSWTKYIFMIPIKSKTTEAVIKAYLKDVYSTFGGSKYILSDRGGEFTSKQFTWLAQESGFIKVYTSPPTQTSNAVIERTQAFLKASLGKCIYNHNTDWDEIAHITAMVLMWFCILQQEKLQPI